MVDIPDVVALASITFQGMSSGSFLPADSQIGVVVLTPMDKYGALAREALDELNSTRSDDEKFPAGDLAGISLYGSEGIFDSMHLVSFLAILEQKLEDELDVEISLTSEKAISQRVSPFSSFTTLFAFIDAELAEMKVGS